MSVKNIFKLALIPAVLMFGSCDKFLDETPKGVVIPKTLNDLEGLLSAPLVVGVMPNNMNYATDEIDLPEANRGPATSYAGRNALNIYDYKPEHYDESEDDADWNRSYQAIYVYNTVLQEVERNTESDLNKKNRLKGEALVHRAYTYLILVNQYAKHYSNTAAQDLGVPLPLKPDINALSKRESVEKVYQQIETDLLEAIDLLPNTPTYWYRPSKVAAYGTLARMYLYQAKWQRAMDYASKALAIKSFLYDYNTFSYADPNNKLANLKGYPGSSIEKKQFIFHKYQLRAGAFYFEFLINQDFFKQYTAGDLREMFGTSNKGYGGANLAGVGVIENAGAYDYNNGGITTQEMYLVHAEAAARLNKLPEALESLNVLRKNRFTPSTFTVLNSGEQTEVLEWALQERMLELAFQGHRLFDIKRLHLQGKDINIKRGTQTFGPTHPLLVFPIPAKNIVNNNNLEQNPRS
ncbi:RagB/SusD family nutrient uptake outer membrane protein [Sphingobacterium yanglingense]|uniref:SusD-like starch-binding protein associating with outer membrane n=1 Tax=Sphingobacterium yanglingense TaxID=1437280 RepID=A0A4R6WJ48_9SPHI|nr:RagB/SusD family nutrient uptake outer membrane protein [Sphingobacterium yanglingense]TDQ80184.1 SusD-like starch-binding protein associating with outer membrane [Sphingobacterium yanglingense]